MRGGVERLAGPGGAGNICIYDARRVAYSVRCAFVSVARRDGSDSGSGRRHPSSRTAYYNRFLSKRLPNPLTDAKQLVLFQNVPVSDGNALREALGALQGFCGKPNLARAYTAIHTRR